MMRTVLGLLLALLAGGAFAGESAVGSFGAGKASRLAGRSPLANAGGGVDRQLREEVAKIPPEVREEFQMRYAAYLKARLGVSRLGFLESNASAMDLAARRAEYKTLVEGMPAHRELAAMGLRIVPLVLALPEQDRPQARFLFLDLLEAVHPRFGAALTAPMQAVDNYAAFWLRNRAYIDELGALAAPREVSAEEVDKRIVWPAQMVFEARMPECSVS